MQTLGTLENIPNPDQSGSGTAQFGGHGVHMVHFDFLAFELPHRLLIGNSEHQAERSIGGSTAADDGGRAGRAGVRRPLSNPLRQCLWGH